MREQQGVLGDGRGMGGADGARGEYVFRRGETKKGEGYKLWWGGGKRIPLWVPISEGMGRNGDRPRLRPRC